MVISQLKHGLGEVQSKMPTFEFPNGTTPDEVLVGVSTSVPAFPIMILVFTWFLLFLGGSVRQNKRFGYADMPAWAVMASLGTLLMSLVFTINSGMIALEVLLVVIAVTILCAIWFFMSRGRFE